MTRYQHTRRAILALCIICGMAAVLHAGSQPISHEAVQALDQIVAKGIADKVYPGAVLVVGTRDRQIMAKGYGHFTYETTSPAMTVDTIFDLASVSKVVGTATCAMLLVEKHKLGLDDLVCSRIPVFAEEGKLTTTTVRDLLTHVSGLPAYENFKKIEQQRKPDESHADAMMRYYASLSHKVPPRTKMLYSCINMEILARVNENASRERQEDFLRREVWRPLGMKNTAYVLTEDQKKRCAPTIVLEDGTLLQGTVHDPLARYHGSDQHCPGNAGVFSSARDLSVFCRMMLNKGRLDGHRIFKPETVKAMTDNQFPPNVQGRHGFGWDIFTWKGYQTSLNNSADTWIVGHTGFTGTLIWIDKKTGMYAILLTNCTYPDEPKTGKNLGKIRRAMATTILRGSPAYKTVLNELEEHNKESDAE